MIVFAVDPGPAQSAWAKLVDDKLDGSGIRANADMGQLLEAAYYAGAEIVLEVIEGFGKSVGEDVFRTCEWVGRFSAHVERLGGEVHRIGRRTVKLHLCHCSSANDPAVRQALIARYGPPRVSVDVAPGKKPRTAPGPTAGLAKDMWAALAVATTFLDKSANSAQWPQNSA
jgi:hypothetical protein